MTFLLTLAIIALLCVPTLIWRYFVVGDDDPDTTDVWIRSVLVGMTFWVCMMIAAAIYSGVEESIHPTPTFTLEKDEWTCTSAHTERRLVGKIIANVSVCDVYERTK